jgi:uncharacterized protein (TIGR03067 family)
MGIPGKAFVFSGGCPDGRPMSFLSAEQSWVVLPMYLACGQQSAFLAPLPERCSIMWKTTAVVVVALLVGVVAAEPDDKKKGEDMIQGTWQAVSVEHGGEKVPEDKVKELKLTFGADGKLTLARGEHELKGTYQLDATKKVKEITLKAEGEKTVLGIYKLDGDDLTVCGVQDGQGDRPTEFTAKAGTKSRLIVFKREKK